MMTSHSKQGNALYKYRQLSIVDIALHLNCMVTRSNTTCCLFHDDHNPSMKLYADSNRFMCFACKAHGDGIDLAMQGQNLASREEAMSWLDSEFASELAEIEENGRYKRTEYGKGAGNGNNAVKYDMEVLSYIFEKPFLSPEAQHFLFNERKIMPWVPVQQHIVSVSDYHKLFAHLCNKFGLDRVKGCGLFYWQEELDGDVLKCHIYPPCILIPYYDIGGKLVAIQQRSVRKGSPYRYRFLKGMKPHHYNMQVLQHIKPTDKLYVCEGITDCLALMSLRLNVIAIPSATLLNDADLLAMARYESIWLYSDNDDAGSALRKEIVDKMLLYGRRIGLLQVSDAYKDVCDMYRDMLKYVSINNGNDVGELKF